MIIDQLPEISAVQETDEIPVEQGTRTYKATLQKIKTIIASLLTKSDVGLGNVANKDLSNVDNVRQYSADNPPNESGSNYCKMPDGTLICWGSTNTLSYGSTAVSFPQSFVAAPAVAISYGAGYTRQPVYVESVTVSGFEYNRPDTNLGQMWARYIAIGRWK